MKHLILGTEGIPVLSEYTDRLLQSGEVLAKTLFGAPKHGTEMTGYKNDPFETRYYDEQAHIFKNRETPKSGKGSMGLGNMWVGEIVETAPDVTDFKVGDRVAGYGNLRPTHISKTKDLLRLNDATTWKQAVCFDPLQFAMGGIRDAHVRLGDYVLISGLGAIGLMAAQAARLAGAAFVAVADPIEIRREAALENGADIAFDPTKEDVGLKLREYTGNRGMDVAIDTSGSYLALEMDLRALAYGGTLALVGWFKDCHVPLNLGREGHFNQQKIVFSRACSDPNNDYPRWSFQRICDEAWEMINAGLFQCENIVAPVIDFDQCAAAYKEYIVDHPDRSVKMGVRFPAQQG